MSLDLKKFYDEHPSYIQRRNKDSLGFQIHINEVLYWKVPFLTSQVIKQFNGKKSFSNIVEIGCGIGDVLASLPVCVFSRLSDRIGIDISENNIKAAKRRYPEMQFLVGNEEVLDALNTHVDLILLSDIIEHVEEDLKFLNLCARKSHYVLINLPLEKCWINRNRSYGKTDKSGHLKSYNISSALKLIKQSRCKILQMEIVSFTRQPVYFQNCRLRYRKIKRNYFNCIAREIILRILNIHPLISRLIFGANLFAFIEFNDKK